jgi:hypothetical protein
MPFCQLLFQNTCGAGIGGNTPLSLESGLCCGTVAPNVCHHLQGKDKFQMHCWNLPFLCRAVDDKSVLSSG